MSGQWDLRLPADVQRKLGNQLGANVLRILAHGAVRTHPRQFNAAVYALDQLVVDMNLKDIRPQPSAIGARNVNCWVTRDGKPAYLKVVGHHREYLGVDFFEAYRALGIASPRILAQGRRLALSVPHRSYGSHNFAFLLTEALSGRSLQAIMNESATPGDLRSIPSVAPDLVDEFARKVLHADLSSQVWRVGLTPWRTQFARERNFPHSVLTAMSRDSWIPAPPPLHWTAEWLDSRPQHPAHFDFAPSNIIAGDSVLAVIDPDEPTLGPRSLAVAFYIVRTEDPLLVDPRSHRVRRLMDPLPLEDSAAALSFYTNLEGCRYAIKSVGTLHRYQSSRDDYHAMRIQQLDFVKELPDGPYKQGAFEYIYENEITPARQDEFAARANADLAVATKYWQHANALSALCQGELQRSGSAALRD